jgi:dTDP-4-amino-4,6-dideoxygalactose transaminase
VESPDVTAAPEAAAAVEATISPVHVEFSPSDIKDILAAIGGLLARGRVSQGENVDAFEQEFARYVGARHAVAVNSGSMAIEAATAALIRRWQSSTSSSARPEVLVQSNTNFATWISVLRGGGTPRLVDIDPATLSPSLEQLRAARAAAVRGVILVHMGGIISAEAEDIARWCVAENLWLIEDCAHAHGSWRSGRHAGTFGQAGAFSFFATKVITSGEGGMVVTDDEAVARHARLFRNLGKPNAWENRHVELGTNGRMTEFSAIVGRTQLARLEAFVQARRKVATIYDELLADNDAVSPVRPDHPISGYKYVVDVQPRFDREKIAAGMRSKGVALSGFIYETPLHRQPALLSYHGNESHPAAEAYCARHLCLPIHAAMTHAEQVRLAEVLKEICRGLQ